MRNSNGTAQFALLYDFITFTVGLHSITQIHISKPTFSPWREQIRSGRLIS